MSDPSSPADTEQRLFAGALELPGEAERAAFLREACGDNARLRQRVEELLRAYFAADNFIASQRDDDFDSDDSSLPEGPGTVIGRYKLIEPIGEGGFGVVYLAEQQEPVRRQVALKIIKPGMDTRQVIARFEAERQALALMDHPNIAKVLDGGVVGRRAEIRNQKSEIETGRPCFVMELVRGIPITRFCEENRLSIKDRLELFIPVCHAIQHAHQKGVIHRDIKPSNVLVTLDNGVPHPMVIDFGVAKAIHQRLTEKTLHTRFAQMIGTPAYMSPEQAEMSKQDVDTRTDVYSLGILLYELLTGTTPFPEERLRQAALAEIQRIITQEEPQRPSTRVGTIEGGALMVLARNRDSRPETLRRLMRGDLDWIVMKALEKDRRRRYGTPNELLADIERHLRNEPVLARRPSPLYRVGKFIRRHRTVVGASAAIALTLILGAGVSIWMGVRAIRAEEQAVSEAAVSKAVTDFLLRDILGQGNPWEADPSLHLRKDTTLRSVIDRAAARIDGPFHHQPEVEGAIRLMIGQTYDRLENPQAAEPHVKRAHDIYRQRYGPVHPMTLAAQEALGWVLRGLGDRAGAAKTFRQVLVLRRKTQGTAHPDTCFTMLALGFVCEPRSHATPLFEEVLRLARNQPQQQGFLTAVATEGLAFIARSDGDLATSKALYARAYEAYLGLFGELHHHTLRIRYQLAYHIWKVDGDVEAAERLLREVLKTSVATWGTDTYLSLYPIWDLARLLDQKGESAEAQQLLHTLLASTDRAYGPSHPYTVEWNRQVGDHHASLGRWQSAAGVLTRLAEADPGNYSHANKAALTVWLSGDKEAAHRLLDRTLNTFESQRESVLPTPLLLTGLLLFRELPQLQRYPRLLQSVDTADDPAWSDLIRGVMAVRRGALDAALDVLLPLKTHSELQTAAIANAFAAIACRRTHQLQASRTAMETLETLMRDHDREGCWVCYACCLIAKTEAESAIQDDTTPPPSAGHSLPGQSRSTTIRSKAHLQGLPAITDGHVYRVKQPHPRDTIRSKRWPFTFGKQGHQTD